ncbi:MAG TPA: high-affinity branched-chain amino acid ABC transporter permease LivM, partial [Rhodospirillales bacterium]|nr:high-affinity branched-chain amino acid ABC transporter permease LivM [Rhodospirillales bacterium]
LLAQHYDLGFWVCLPFAGLMAATAGIILGFPVLRLRGDYLAIVTLGFGEMIRIILLNWYEFTKGPDGLSGIPRPTFFGLPFTRSPPEGVETFHSFFNLAYSPTDRIIFLYYVILVMALATNLFTLRIRKLPVGRAWEALREDEIACRSLGINPRNTKLTAFSIGAMFGGFGGSFFATRQGFISPESFTFIESAVILAIVVLGGMGSQIGVVFAAILLIGLPEIFRELHQYRMLAFGAAMVLIMVWRPQGLLAHREPTLHLPERPPDAPRVAGAAK